MSIGEKHSIKYGKRNIDYCLFYKLRKTMEIAVHPDSNVIVTVPVNSNLTIIEKKIKKRSRWIIKQINYFQQFSPKTPGRSYVNGETHLYLGKQYRLKIIKGKETGIKLSKGFFLITSCEEAKFDTFKILLEKWYFEKASIYFEKRMNCCWENFKKYNLVKPSIKIKKMKSRWGSLSIKGNINLNIELIKAPIECIDYVITHELCHLKHNNHSNSFYNLLEVMMPGWKKIKHKLELSMV